MFVVHTYAVSGVEIGLSFGVVHVGMHVIVNAMRNTAVALVLDLPMSYV